MGYNEITSSSTNNFASGGNGDFRFEIQEPPDPVVIAVDPTGRYECHDEVIGRGAFKTVYRGLDKFRGQEIAWNQVRIDELLQSPHDLARLYSEIHLLKTVCHPHIIKFYASWINDRNKTVNIITELFSGSLKQFRMRYKGINMYAVKVWAREILNGLDYLHSHDPPIIHRDLKCDNIFINAFTGDVTIGDLGLATVMHKSCAHSVIGTPEFMAPELYDENYNELVDIYSFGMCILELVTLEYPYVECKNPAQIYKKVSSGIKPEALSKLKDPEVKAFIEKCLLPAAQRLPARELLKDPFLQIDGLDGDLRDHSSSLPDIITPKAGAFGDRCLLSEEPVRSGQRIPFPLFSDVDISESPIISIINNAGEDGSYFLTLEVEKRTRGVIFRLMSEFGLIKEMSDADSTAMRLRITYPNGPVRNVHFSFFVDGDTALSVASEMAEQFELDDADRHVIAQLIDSLLINLVPGWQPCISGDQLVKLERNDYVGFENQLTEFGKTAADPLHGDVFAEAKKTFGYSQSMDHRIPEGLIHQKEHYMMTSAELDDIMAQIEYLSMNMVASEGSEDWDSTASFVSANSHMDQVPEVQYFNDLPSCNHEPGTDSELVMVDENEDNEMRMELQQIKLQYQQEMNEIYRKREEAIAMAEGKAAKRRQKLDG